MFATYQVFADSKENQTDSSSLKSGFQSTNKGCKGRGIKHFKESTNISKNRQNVSQTVGQSKKQLSAICKENIKQEKEKEMYQETKPAVGNDSCEEWSDIEEMHIYPEPDDDYEDIIPKAERIQKSEIDFLFSIYPIQKAFDYKEDSLPIPPEIEVISPDIVTPSFVPEAALYDDTPLMYIPDPERFMF